MRLFLAGGGTAEQSSAIDTRFATAIPDPKRVLYWSMALRGIRPPKDCLAWIQHTLGDFGIHDIVMWPDFADHTGAELLHFDALYIGGGNTHRLLGDLRASGFDVHLTNFAKAGGPVYGGSAGAAILGRSIATVAHLEPNVTGLDDDAGLDLTGGTAIWVHYEPTDDPAILECAHQLDCAILALAADGGIALIDQNIASVGGGVFHFDQSGKRPVT